MSKCYQIEKVGFAVSILVFAIAYGVAIGKWKYFPYSFLDKAYTQAREVKVALSSRPDDLVPRVYSRQGIRTPRPEKMQEGLTLITSRWGPSYKWGVRLIDENGAILHEWLVDGENFFQTDTAIHGSLLLQDGDVVLNREYQRMVRLNSCGEVLWEVDEGNHHSITQAEDGSFWTPGVSKGRSRSGQYPEGYPGLKGRQVWLDQLVHISADGKILEKYNVMDIIYKNDLQKYIAKYYGKGGNKNAKNVLQDVTHMNDVEPLSSRMSGEYPLL
jgi:hypothetical protein